jgi:hypothetical protein
MLPTRTPRKPLARWTADRNGHPTKHPVDSLYEAAYLIVVTLGRGVDEARGKQAPTPAVPENL